ncbi:pilus assembly protein, partial [Escherichia coli]|nr:pilus assembly protein [Escherichia coli]
MEERANISTNRGLYSLTLNESSLLSQEVKNWAQKQGYKLLWKSDKDYIIY